MRWIRQDDVGRCAFLDVLEEAVITRHPAVVELVDGSQFEARVVDVVTRAGDEFVRFADGREIVVGQIAAMTRAV